MGVICVDMMDVRACGADGAGGLGEGVEGMRSSWDVRWLARRSGSGVLLVSRVWDAVVMRARRGRVKECCIEGRVSERHCRAVRLRSDIVVLCNGLETN